MYTRIMNTVTALPWAILPEKLAAIQSILALRAEGKKLTPVEIKEIIHAAQGERPIVGGAVAVISIVGSLVPRGDLFMESSGAVSVQRIQQDFRSALGSPDIASIVLDIDSPGGQVGGVAELASEIHAARGLKPIIAVANNLAASAAYWLATAADEIVMTPSAEVGSIGVFAIHQDISAALVKAGVNVTMISAGKFKTEGNPFQPLGEVALAAAQDRVDEFYAMFVSAVAQHRDTTPAAVRNGFGEGRVVGASQAVTLGMADQVATIDEVIGGLVSSGQAGRTRADMLATRRRRLRAYSR